MLLNVRNELFMRAIYFGLTRAVHSIQLLRVASILEYRKEAKLVQSNDHHLGEHRPC